MEGFEWHSSHSFTKCIDRLCAIYLFCEKMMKLLDRFLVRYCFLFGVIGCGMRWYAHSWYGDTLIPWYVDTLIHRSIIYVWSPFYCRSKVGVLGFRSVVELLSYGNYQQFCCDLCDLCKCIFHLVFNGFSFVYAFTVALFGYMLCMLWEGPGHEQTGFPKAIGADHEDQTGAVVRHSVQHPGQGNLDFGVYWRLPQPNF